MSVRWNPENNVNKTSMYFKSKLKKSNAFLVKSVEKLLHQNNPSKYIKLLTLRINNINAVLVINDTMNLVR